MVVKDISSKEFKRYGRVLENYDITEISLKMNDTPLPDGVVYEPSIEFLEDIKMADELKNREFGGLDIQIGYCNGNNHLLNAVEYHRSSEINIAVTDIILLLGMELDIEEDFSYDTSKLEAFLVPKGTIIEVFATTLHYAPCNVNEEGFKCVVVLPKGTNTELETKIEKNAEDLLLFAKNKWLIAHPDTDLRKQGAFIGLKGENIRV